MKRWLFVFLLAPCAAFAQETKEWRLVKVRQGAQLVDAMNKDTEFTISIKEKKFAGKVGCNKFNGKLQFTKGDQIQPITLSKTKYKCPEELSQLENDVIEAVYLSDRLVFRDNVAEFYNQTRLVLVLEKSNQ